MLHAVIMAGGSGTRFWPKSRRDKPKQLLRLLGDSTMIQRTAARIQPLVPFERMLVITGEDQAELTRQQLPDLPDRNMIAEPCPRDTAPCVGLAAAIVRHRDPEGVMVVLPADHVIEPAEGFLTTLRAAVEAVESNPESFVTFGVPPDRPETGYGYIERAERLGKPYGIPLHRVARFREKPSREQAEEFLASGRFVWNSGIFVWKAAAILEALDEHRPKLREAIAHVSQTIDTPEFEQALKSEYPNIERIPIDKAVLERARNVRVLDVAYRWNDVGDWRALSGLIPPDSEGNTVQGPVRAVDTRNSIVVADEGGLVATLGIDDLVVVQAGGATLVARRDALDRLKAVVEGLGEAGFGEWR